MKLLGISGSIIGEKLPTIIREVLHQAKEIDPNLTIELLDLKEYQVEFVDGRPFDQYNEDTQTVINKIKEADFYIIGSPVYQASITGVLKNLFDHLPMNIFEGKTVGLVMTGGTEKHYLVLEHQLRPIVTFLKGIVAPKTLFIHQNDDTRDPSIQSRINELVKEIIYLQSRLATTNN